MFQKRIYDMLMESQYWSPGQMLDYQQSQIAQLLRHARANVPFYKTRLDAVFRKNGDIDWNRWSEIPIVTRSDLRDNYVAMRASTLPAGHGPTKIFRSSGSSGIPIAVDTTAIMSAANEVAALRFLENQGLDTTRTRANISSYTFGGEPLHDEFQRSVWGKPWESGDRAGRYVIINRDLPDERKLKLIKFLEVSYLQDITNNAELLARANLAVAEPVKFEAIICIGQKITREHRDLFWQSFGARTLSIYSSKEGGMMGYQCGDSSSLHLNREINFIEIADQNGAICELGQEGRVIMTPFFSTALPLIRYDQGDMAELQSPCDCGSSHPAFRSITGRQDQLLKLPNGLHAVGVLFQKLMTEDMNALAFQLAQTASLKLEVRYIPANIEKHIVTAPIVARIHELIHPGLEVTFKIVERIPLNSGGKQQRVVCEI
jgi:phenylacetate-CoA ligase